MRADVMAAGYARAVRPILFRRKDGDAEEAHQDTLQRLGALGRSPRAMALVRRLCTVPTRPVQVAGLTFPGSVGLAAGVDKDAVALTSWSALGFGHIEIGTVTPRPQAGNERPRLFRVVDSGGIVNRMGFNNDGVEAVAERLREAGKLDLRVGVSIGKNKATPIEESTQDYLHCVRELDGLVDYLAVNVSSPNTPGLRGLQDREPLEELLATVVDESSRLAADRSGTPVPIFLKIAPDLSNEAMDDVLEVAEHADIAGIVATNSTTAREGLVGPDLRLVDEEGGLSGRPLTRRTRRVVKYVVDHTQLPVIGVGGVMTVDDGKALIDAGASMVQLYTGFVYAGPALVRDLNKALG